MDSQVVAELERGRNEEHAQPDQHRQRAPGTRARPACRPTAASHDAQLGSQAHVDQHEHHGNQHHPEHAVAVLGSYVRTGQDAPRSNHHAGGDQAGTDAVVPATRRRSNGVVFVDILIESVSGSPIIRSFRDQSLCRESRTFALAQGPENIRPIRGKPHRSFNQWLDRVIVHQSSDSVDDGLAA